MDVQSAINVLEQAWDQPDGALGALRTGQLDDEGMKRIVQVLQAVDLGSDAQIDRRFVALVWFIPTFMSWQRERVQEQGGDPQRLDSYIDQVINALYAVLGTP